MASDDEAGQEIARQWCERKDRLMEAIFKVHEIWNIRISTGRLNRWLAPVIERTPPNCPGEADTTGAGAAVSEARAGDTDGQR